MTLSYATLHHRSQYCTKKRDVKATTNFQKKCILIHANLVESKENTDSSFEMNPTTRFLNQVKKYQKILEHINEVTNNLQTQMHYISSCQADREFIIYNMEGKRKYLDNELHGNNLGKEYISPSLSGLKNPHLESGVIKIQNNVILNMTVEKHNACENLRLNKNDGYNYNDNNDDDLYEKSRTRFKCRKKNVNNDYGNYNFIIGVSAVVERLCLMRNKLLDGNRIRIYPLLMESLFFASK